MTSTFWSTDAKAKALHHRVVFSDLQLSYTSLVTPAGRSCPLANCVCTTLMQPCCSQQALPWKASTEESQASEVILSQSTPAADKKSHLIFTLHTPDLLLHGAHVLTFMSESDESNKLLPKKMFRGLCDILPSLTNPMHRGDTFAYLFTTSSSKKFNPECYHSSSEAALNGPSCGNVAHHYDQHMWGGPGNKSVPMTQAVSLCRHLLRGNGKGVMFGRLHGWNWNRKQVSSVGLSIFTVKK